MKDLDAVVVPVSGGGMSSGIALATKAVNPGCKVILTAPEVGISAVALLWYKITPFPETSWKRCRPRVFKTARGPEARGQF